jgi:hypothetical protein
MRPTPGGAPRRRRGSRVTPLALGLAILGAPRAAWCQAEPAPAPTATRDRVHLSLGADGVSRYIFGGLTFSDRPVVHPSLAGTFKGFTLTGYGTYYTDPGRFAEADLFLEYTRSLGKLAAYAGASRYHFKYPEGWRGTTEVYAAASWQVALQPTVTVTEDFDIGDGGMVEASLGHDLRIGSRTVSATLSLTHNRHYYSELTGLSHLQLALQTSFSTGRLTWTPKVAGLRSLRDDVQSTVYFGLALKLDL